MQLSGIWRVDPRVLVLSEPGNAWLQDTLASLGMATLSTAANPGVGTYAITISGLVSANYTITVDNTGVLTVMPRPITVKASNVTKVYGDPTPPFSAFLSLGTFGYTDTLAALGTASFSTTPASPVNVSSYAISVSGLSNANYTITYDNTGSLTITVRPTVTSLSSNLELVTPVKVNLTATVSAVASVLTPIGSVTFTDSFTGLQLLGSPVNLDSNGQAKLSTSSLAVGQHVITATYNPSPNFGMSASATNAAPSATITGPPTGSVQALTSTFDFTGTFTDASGNTPDATAAWSFDAISVDGVVSQSSGTVTKSYQFSNAGVYAVTLTLNDNLGGITITNAVVPDNLPAMIVAYDPTAGFVTGGGWIQSPAGAYVAGPSLTGKANFGFVSKYLKGSNIPTGETEFQLHFATFNFHSSSYQWLVVSGARAQYKGTGKINGAGNTASF